MCNYKRSLILFLFIVLVVTPFTIIQAEEHAEMEVHFIDVGQGDSILIKTPSDKIILIDGGPPKAGKKVFAYLNKLHIDKIDILVATHPDIDHIGGLPYLLDKVEVDQIIDSGKFHTTLTYAKYINQIRKHEIPVNIARKNERIDIDPLLNIQILNTFEFKKGNNQSSIVLKINYKEIDFLLMGDVEREQEIELLKKYNLKADIVKVAHHGSKTSSSAAFLKEVNPKVALITYSKENEYGHPVHRVIDNLYKLNTHIYSTAVFGDVIVSTDGQGFFILPKKSPMDGILETKG